MRPREGEEQCESYRSHEVMTNPFHSRLYKSDNCRPIVYFYILVPGKQCIVQGPGNLNEAAAWRIPQDKCNSCDGVRHIHLQIVFYHHSNPGVTLMEVS